MYEELTREILGACFDVSHELGPGFLESVYHKALRVALQDRGLSAASQVPLVVKYKENVVGEFYADLLVEQEVLVELKATSGLLPEHQSQLINYLRATGLQVGLLVNFGTPKVQYKRCANMVQQTVKSTH